MTKRFLEKQKLVLLKALERLQAAATGRAVHAVADGGGDLGDVGAAIAAADAALALRSNAANLRYEIDRALAKFAKGTYGLCESTGEPINEERLEAIPWARFSIKAQMELEKGRPLGSRHASGPLFDDASKEAEESVAEAEEE